MNVVMCTSALIHVLNIVLTFLKNPAGALDICIIYNWNYIPMYLPVAAAVRLLTCIYVHI